MIRRTRGERWYTRLLRLYPRDFRDEFGGEMARLYRDRARDESFISLWRSLVGDLLRTAPSEHLSILTHDVRHAWRGLLRTPAVTLTIILTLALGVGASTAVFSVVHAVLLRPLPYPESKRIVEIFEDDIKNGGPFFRVSALNYLSMAERSRSLDSVGAFRSTGATLTGDGNPELLGGSSMTASVFRVLQLSPIAGRGLDPGDDQPGAPRVVVLGESLWRARFGGDRQIVGRTILLDGERHEIVGVMPQAFREVGRTQIGATGDAQIFLPMRIDPAQENRGNHTLRVIGRLRRDVSLGQARDEMRAVGAALAQEFPATNRDWSVRLDPLTETMIEPRVRRSLLLALGAVAMVFLIACGNVANLLLARGMRRQSELSLRTALGAGRSRLVRQLLTESVCLSAISGVAGVLVAAATQPLTRLLLPPSWPRLTEMRLDLDVLAFGLVISVVSGLVFGVMPAVRASRLDPARALVSGGRATADSSRVRLRQVLVACEVALATALLVCAALFLQGFVRLQRVPLGFEPDGVTTTRISLPTSAYPNAVRTAQFYDRLLTLLHESGLETVAVATSAPFGPGVRASFQPAKVRSSPSRGAHASGVEHIVSGEYFRALDIPVLSGRSFDERDTALSPAVAIVSQNLARRLWPDANPLGQPLERSGRSFDVVGVVGDVRGSDGQGQRGGGPEREPAAAVYFAAAQLPQRTMTLVARTPGEQVNVAAAIRGTVRQLDPTLALQALRPLRDWMVDSMAPARLMTTLAAMFAVSAVLLTSVGIYGVLAYTVTSRTREMGVRMAMGATRSSVLGLVLREGMTWAGSGILGGLIAAYAAASLIGTLLFGVAARDPFTFAIVGCAIGLVALTACSIPALRAVRIDPTITMRAE